MFTQSPIVSNWITGSVDVGTSPVPIIAAGADTLQSRFAVSQQVRLKAAPSNTNVVYIGPWSDVTAGTAAATDGYPLSAGQEIILSVADLRKIFAIGGAASQKLYFSAF